MMMEAAGKDSSPRGQVHAGERQMKAISEACNETGGLHHLASSGKLVGTSEATYCSWKVSDYVYL